jgi:CRP-like cAMP-binding protein
VNDSENSKIKENSSTTEEESEVSSTVERQQKRICFCRAHSQTKIKWDLFIMFLATVNCFQVPYNVAFTDSSNSNIYIDMVNLAIDIMFMIDVFINFRSSYVDDVTGEETADCKSITINYIKGRFWIDLIASLPIDTLSYAFEGFNDNSVILDFLGLLKLVRVLRLSRLITYLNLKNELKMSLKLIKLIFFLVLYLHCLGCLWFFIVNFDKDWIPPLDYVWISTDVYDRGAFFQYTTSLYHAVLMLGGNDIGPRGEFQLWFVLTTLILGAIINANIFGNMAVLLQALNRKAATFQEKLETANETMKNLKIPEKIQDDVKSYLTYTQSTLDHQNELDKFFKMLSPSLTKQISNHINLDALNRNPLLSGNQEVITFILSDLTTKLYFPEDEIIRQTDKGQDMYFIAKGEWDVYITDENWTRKYTTTLKNGSHFGEIALLKSCKRTATVTSKNYSTLAAMNKMNFDELVQRYPDVKEAFNRFIMISYNDKWKKFQKRALRNIDYLNSPNINDPIIEELLYKLEPITVSKDTFIFKAGTPCKDIHIVTSGELDVYVNNNNKDTYLDTLYTGWVIGSYSALTSEYYAITGKAKTECKLLVLKYKDLFDVRQIFDELDLVMIDYENYCDENGLPYWDYKLHRNRNLDMLPIEKFRAGIKRIVRIVKSYKSSALTDLLKQVAEKVKHDKKQKENKRKKILKHSSQLSPIERNEQSIIALTEKVERLRDVIEDQSEMIKTLKEELFTKMEQLNIVRIQNNFPDSSDSSFEQPKFKKISKPKKLRKK